MGWSAVSLYHRCQGDEEPLGRQLARNQWNGLVRYRHPDEKGLGDYRDARENYSL
jgi:hypothetical protein